MLHHLAILEELYSRKCHYVIVPAQHERILVGAINFPKQHLSLEKQAGRHQYPKRRSDHVFSYREFLFSCPCCMLPYGRETAAPITPWSIKAHKSDRSLFQFRFKVPHGELGRYLLPFGMLQVLLKLWVWRLARQSDGFEILVDVPLCNAGRDIVLLHFVIVLQIDRGELTRNVRHRDVELYKQIILAVGVHYDLQTKRQIHVQCVCVW